MIRVKEPSSHTHMRSWGIVSSYQWGHDQILLNRLKQALSLLWGCRQHIHDWHLMTWLNPLRFVVIMSCRCIGNVNTFLTEPWIEYYVHFQPTLGAVLWLMTYSLACHILTNLYISSWEQMHLKPASHVANRFKRLSLLQPAYETCLSYMLRSWCVEYRAICYCCLLHFQPYDLMESDFSACP